MAMWFDHDGSSDSGDVGEASNSRLSTSATIARKMWGSRVGGCDRARTFRFCYMLRSSKFLGPSLVRGTGAALAAMATTCWSTMP